MANRKITELTALTGANATDTDVFAIVDVSADETKKMTLGELKEAFDSGSGFVRITGDTMTGALDVQSTITADGLTVDGVARLQGGAPYLYLDNSSNTGSSRIYFGDSDSDITGYFLYDHSSNSLRTGVNGSERMRIDSSGNVGIGTSSPLAKIHSVSAVAADAAQFSDGANYTLAIRRLTSSTGGMITGTAGSRLGFGTDNTERMRIDNSGNVGIGTQVPGAKLHISNTGGNADIALQGSASGESIINFGDTGDLDVGQILYNHTSNYMRFLTNTSEAMRITSSGNVGIGDTSPASPLSIHNSSTPRIEVGYSDTQNHYLGWDSSKLVFKADPQNLNAASGILFDIDGSERMRIDSSGWVGIGTSSPSYPLDVEDSSSGFIKASFVSTGSPHSSITFDNTGSSASSVRVGSNNNDFYVRTSGSESMRIDSSGNVGIGTSSPVTDLTIFGGTGSTQGITIQASGWSYNYRLGMSGTSGGDVLSTTNYSFALSSVDSASYGTTFISQNVSGQIAFGTGGANTAPTERMRIDSSGNVGIGVTNPSDYYSTKLVVDAEGGEDGITIVSSSAAEAYLMFADGTSGNEAYRGFVGYSHASDYLRFATSGSEVMRIDSSGNLLVGTTTSAGIGNGSTNEGINLSSSQRQIAVGTISDVSLYLNRMSSDGTIAEFRKNGTAVGKISVADSDNVGFLSTVSNHGGIICGTASIVPALSGTYSNGATDIGTGTSKWRDIYLSGGVYLGGTGSGNPTNKLDDYEAGDFNAALTSASGSISVDASFNKLLYTKVGRLVTITGRFRIGSVSSASGAFYLTLPFTSINFAEEADFAALNLITYGVDLDADAVSTFGEVSPNSTQCYAYQQRDNNSWIVLDASGISAGDTLYFTGTYTAA